MDDDIFTRAGQRGAGRTDGQITYELAQRRWLRLRAGVFCARALYDTARNEQSQHRFRVRAAQECVQDDAAASMWSAALIHGLPVPYAREHEVSLTRASNRPRHYPGLRVRVAELPQEHVVMCDGVATTSVARTVVDLARNLPLVDAVVVADASLHQSLTTKAELVAVVERCKRWPGLRRARDVVDFADGAAESPLESRSRVRLVRDYAVPAPALNALITDGHGRPVARVDMLWPEHRTIGEADGAAKYGTERSDTLFREKQREDALRDLGYEVVRWTFWDIERTARRVAERVQGAFLRTAA